MAHNFYYGKDADIVAGSAVFSAAISATPTAYGLVAAQATAFAALNTTLQSASSAVSNPATRTPVTVSANRLAIKNMRNNAILLSKIIYATSTVTDAQLTGLGLLPRPARTPVGPPSSAPDLDVVSVTGNRVLLRMHDDTVPTKRGKPDGVDGAAVYSFVGAVPPNEEAEWTFEGITSKTRIEVAFPTTVVPGSQVWFTAFWFNARKQNGPPADKVTTNLQGGAAMAA